MPIISITSDKKTAQTLALRYATRNYVLPDGEGVAYQLATDLKKEQYFATESSEPVRVAIVTGQKPGTPGTTDTIRIRTVE